MITGIAPDNPFSPEKQDYAKRLEFSGTRSWLRRVSAPAIAVVTPIAVIPMIAAVFVKLPSPPLLAPL
jgi:hypothetical protein